MAIVHLVKLFVVGDVIDGEGVDDVGILVADAFQLSNLFPDFVNVFLKVVDVGHFLLLSVDLIRLQVPQVFFEYLQVLFQRVL